MQSLNDPATTLATRGRLIVFIRGTDNRIYARWQETSNGNWCGWAPIGSPPNGVSSGPAVALNADGGLVVFARAIDNAVWHTWQTRPDARWEKWASLGRATLNDPAATLATRGRLIVFIRDTSTNNIYARWELTSHGNWSGWASIEPWGGHAASGPAVALNADGGLVAFVRRADNTVWHTWQTRPDTRWEKWASLEGATLHDPGATLATQGRLVVFICGIDNNIYTRWQLTSNGNWSGWAPIGSPPRAALPAAQPWPSMPTAASSRWPAGRTTPSGTRGKPDPMPLGRTGCHSGERRRTTEGELD